MRYVCPVLIIPSVFNPANKFKFKLKFRNSSAHRWRAETVLSSAFYRNGVCLEIRYLIN